MHVIGLDLGTTSTKAVVFDLQGQVVSEGNVEYPLLTPHPGWAEQDPESICHAAELAVADAINKAGAIQLIGIGISCAMHSLILIDESHQPLSKVVIWADNRSTLQADRLKDINGHEIYLRTGTPIHPMAPLSKIIWFRENEPELYKRASKFISVKEYLLYRWFKEYVTDYSIASATGLFNLNNLDYDELALEATGITREQLSKPVPTTYVLQGIDPVYAQKMNIPANLPVTIGASDGCLANLGIGALSQGEIAITIGTSAAIRTVVPRPLTDARARTFCYALDETHWVVGGPSNNGGILFRWFRDQLGIGETYDQLTAKAATVPPGSEGLLCLPYVSGERAPIWNAQARGCFFGMGLHHAQPHFIRAVLEGVIFNLYGIGKALKELSGEFKSVKASGGFVRSPLWCQILADIFGTEVIVPENPQSSSWGAAILAILALGKISNIEHYTNSTFVGHNYIPDATAHNTYQKLYPIFEEVYESLSKPFKQITKFQEK